MIIVFIDVAHVAVSASPSTHRFTGLSIQQAVPYFTVDGELGTSNFEGVFQISGRVPAIKNIRRKLR